MMIQSKMGLCSEAMGYLKASLRHEYLKAYEAFQEQLGVRLILGDNPYRMDYARDIAKDCQQDIDPEVLADPHLQEHS